MKEIEVKIETVEGTEIPAAVEIKAEKPEWMNVFDAYICYGEC